MADYGRDLAAIHDVGFGDFSRRAAPGILALLRRAGVSRGARILELGCGSGILAARLVAAGYRVHGVDLSPAMVALARRRAPEATFAVGSFLDAVLPPCAAVLAVGEVLGYRSDRRHGRRALARLFARVHRALPAGGLFLFDLAGPGRGRGPRQRFFEGADWACLVESDEDPVRARLTRRCTSFRRIGARFRRDREVHVLDLHRPADVLAGLRRTGFRARALRGYGAAALPRALTVFHARRA